MLLTVLLSVGLILLDQLFKWMAIHFLAPEGSFTAIPSLLEFRYVENDGAAFSMLSGQQGILIAITGVILLVGAYILLFKRPKDKLEYIAVLLIFSGGTGNLIDRIANGYVVDYFNFLFMRFAVFNLADVFVTVGFALLIFAVFRAERKAKKAKKEEQAGEEETTALETGEQRHHGEGEATQNPIAMPDASKNIPQADFSTAAPAAQKPSHTGEENSNAFT